MNSRPFMIIGAPVHERGWVLPLWFHHLAAQDLPWEEVELVFNYGASSDDTLEVIEAARDWRPWTITVLEDEAEEHQAQRRWNLQRYEVMARLRNRLLEHVRERNPIRYFSLDTDILLPPGAVEALLDDLTNENLDAVGPLVHMTTRSTAYPNAMHLGSGTRPKVHDFTMLVDVVFAAVMMKPRLYREVDYSANMRGEDIGWGINAKHKGMKMALNPRVVCKHVMTPELVDLPDPRLGW